MDPKNIKIEVPEQQMHMNSANNGGEEQYAQPVLFWGMPEPRTARRLLPPLVHTAPDPLLQEIMFGRPQHGNGNPAGTVQTQPVVVAPITPTQPQREPQAGPSQPYVSPSTFPSSNATYKQLLEDAEELIEIMDYCEREAQAKTLDEKNFNTINTFTVIRDSLAERPEKVLLPGFKL